MSPVARIGEAALTISCRASGRIDRKVLQSVMKTEKLDAGGVVERIVEAHPEIDERFFVGKGMAALREAAGLLKAWIA